MVSEAAASCALSSTTSYLWEVGLVYIQGNDFIPLMSGSLGYMDLKSEIDGIDKSSSSIFEFKFATKLVKSGESMPLYIVHLLHCCAAASFLS